MGTSLSILKLRRTHASSSRVLEMEKESYMLHNGGMLLEELLHSCDGKCNPFRIFSADELAKATNDYREQYSKDGFYKMYKGSFNGRQIYVKSFHKYEIDFAINEVVFASQLNNHKNILMILGCCLETEIPMLVFESAENGTLSDNILEPCTGSNNHQKLLLWDCRLKIAKEIADALAYLHTGLSMPIIHRDVKLRNIYLDGNYVAKLSEFSLAVSIPSGEEYVETDGVRGTPGYVAPEYLATWQLTEKCDVYSFGLLLFEILSGERISTLLQRYMSRSGSESNVETNSTTTDLRNKYIHQACMEAAEEHIGSRNKYESHWKQLLACTELALRCYKDSPVERPTMKEAAKELRRIIKLQ